MKALLTEYKESFVWSNEQVDAIKRIKSARDFYEILGVPKSATDLDIKKAYKKLALKYHPDKCKAPGTSEAFQIVAKAFDILGDAQKRRNYDYHGADYFDQQTAKSNSRRRANHHHHHHHHSENLSTDELFNLIFGSYFSSNPASHRF